MNTDNGTVIFEPELNFRFISRYLESICSCVCVELVSILELRKLQLINKINSNSSLINGFKAKSDLHLAKAYPSP